MSFRADDEALGFLITDVARLLRAEFDRAIAAENIGITPGEARTLSHVARTYPLRQTALAERMGVEAMTLSSFLDRLEERGLIKREPDPSDGRAKLVTLTEAADEVLLRIRNVGIAVRKDVEAGIPPQEWKGFMSTLKQMRGNLWAKRQEAARARSAA
ncbi:MAG: MarR family winged helix-turn-helix transcriptional regulator [Rhizobiaceae bacterium]